LDHDAAESLQLLLPRSDRDSADLMMAMLLMLVLR
jgi:hypothetical protein